MGAESPALQGKGNHVKEAWVPKWAQGDLSVGAQKCISGEDIVKASRGLWGSPRGRWGVEVAGGSAATSSAVHSVLPGLPSHQCWGREYVAEPQGLVASRGGVRTAVWKGVRSAAAELLPAIHITTVGFLGKNVSLRSSLCPARPPLEAAGTTLQLLCWPGSCHVLANRCQGCPPRLPAGPAWQLKAGASGCGPGTRLPSSVTSTCRPWEPPSSL